ncbi:thiamine pyrophosphate-dependent enzyme [Raineyella fluvialis]|uniref:thiamine pyrophosphate-dependent enzyme n=1 Tax=Raineyella fluvialis TaxID=2662261 RepID=UPI001EEFA7E7|nr:thiamine pyrophosphate-dependent enzyme [Raineyella fluvialis]
MGPGVPYVIGAKFAHPDRPAVAFVGDGAMQMNGLAELITIDRYWRDWADPRLVVAVLHNNDLNQVTWELRAMTDSPKVPQTQTIPEVDYAGFATDLGLLGITVLRPEELAQAWERALTADRPTVLDVHVDPDVPPVPPHSTFEQVKSVTKALVQGDEDAWGLVREGIKTKAAEVRPHHTDRDEPGHQ